MSEELDVWYEVPDHEPYSTAYTRPAEPTVEGRLAELEALRATVARVEALRQRWMREGYAPFAIELRVALEGGAEAALRRALDN